MAAQATTSQILAKVKGKLKGGWKKARSVTPKARSQGGLPQGIKGAVATCAEFKAALTSKGDPYFSLTGVIQEPEELKDRRATSMWFINDSRYSTAQDEAEKMANDLALLLPAIGQEELPDDEAGILEVMKELCEAQVPFIFDTSRHRDKTKNGNVIIQGLAEGFEGAAASNGEAGDAGDEDPEASVEGEVDPEAEGGEVIPQVGDEFMYPSKDPKTKKAKEFRVKLTAVDENTGKVALETVGHKPKLTWKSVSWDKLEFIEE